MQHLVMEEKPGLQPGTSLDGRMEHLLAAGGCPLVIPSTTPRRYLSLRTTLNLRIPSKKTGDWHAVFSGEECVLTRKMLRFPVKLADVL